MMTSSAIVAKTLARRCRPTVVARPLLAAHNTTHTTSTRRFLSDDTGNKNNDSKTDHLIPGAAFHQSAFGSLGDPSFSPSSNTLAKKKQQ